MTATLGDWREAAGRDRAPAGLVARVAAEALGTFALTFVAAGAIVIGAVSHGRVGPAAQVVAPGLLVMAMIYALGEVSGAHFNPAVTLAFAVRRDFPWSLVPAYVMVQLLAACAAAALLRALFGDAAHAGATVPHAGLAQAVVMEVILTFLLMTVILGTAIDHRLVGHNAALAVGATVALCGLFAGPISGASMNPARSFGPAVLGGSMGSYWVYAVGPLAGAGLAVLFAMVVRGRESRSERQAAAGSAPK